MKTPASRKRLLRCAAAMVVLAVISIGGLLYSKARITSASVGRVFIDASEVPVHEVALVLGCSPLLADGRSNLYFDYRIQAARELFQARKVRFLLVSGDNSRADYDESSEMKKALIALGVPAGRIFCDYAGFSTLDSVVRAREVFQQESMIVVSQEFHVRRAIYIGRGHGLDLVGYTARDVQGRAGARTRVRESLARLKAVLDVEVFGRGPKFLGEPIRIAEGSVQVN